MKIYERLKSLRKERNLLQKDIADFLNISKSAYGYYEQGRNEPDIQTILKLAELYQVSADYLLCRVDIERECLTEKESELLGLYRRLNQDEKNIVLGAVYALSVKKSLYGGEEWTVLSAALWKNTNACRFFAWSVGVFYAYIKQGEFFFP